MANPSPLSLGSLYRELVQVAPRTYLPLLGLQLVALIANLAVTALPEGSPVRGAMAALVPLVVDPLVTGASLAYAAAAIAGPAGPDFETAVAGSIRTWPVLVTTGALTVIAAMAPTGWLFYLAYRRFEQAFLGGEEPLAYILPFVGMLACAVPGIYLGVRLFVTVPLLFAELHGPLSPLARSWQLTRGYWWPSALAFMPLGLLSALIAVPVSLLLMDTAVAGLLLPTEPRASGLVVAFRLVGPLGWTLYMLYCLRLLGTASREATPR